MDNTYTSQPAGITLTLAFHFYGCLVDKRIYYLHVFRRILFVL